MSRCTCHDIDEDCRMLGCDPDCASCNGPFPPETLPMHIIDRSIDLFDEEHPLPEAKTTHIYSYLRHEHGGYVLHAAPYSLTGDETRLYPLSRGKRVRIEDAPRYSEGRLKALAADPTVRSKARALIEAVR